jgi:hypothetical protein
MGPLAILKRWTDIREGEEALLRSASVYAFLSVCVLGVATTTSEALFVSAFDLGQLSVFVIATAVTRAALTLAFGALARSHAGASIGRPLLVATAAVLAVTALASESATGAWLAFLCLMQIAVPSLLPLAAFNAILDRLDTRQAKRLVPLVASAATVGQIVAGALSGYVARALGLRAVIALGAVIAVASLRASFLRSPGAAEASAAPARAGGPSLAEAFAETNRDVAQVPLVRIVLTNAVLASVLCNLVDFGFKASLKARLERDEIAAFLGTFVVASELVVLAVQVFFASRIVRWFGLRGALRATPLAILVTLPLAPWLPPLRVASAMKFVESTGRYALGGTADVLLGPLASDVRARAKVVVKGLATPLGALVAGIVLRAFGAQGPPFAVLLAIVGAVAAAAAWVLGPVRRAYTQALAEAVFEVRDSMGLDPQTREVVRATLTEEIRAAADAGAWGLVRDYVRAAEGMGLTPVQLGPAMAAPDPSLRREVLTVASRGIAVEHADELLTCFAPVDDPATEHAVLEVARSRGVVAPLARLVRARDLGRHADDRGPLWGEAMLGLAAHRREEVLRELRREAASADSPMRAAAIDALTTLGDTDAFDDVRSALNASSSVVLRAAARAAIVMDPGFAIPILLARLAGGPDARGAARALALGGADVVAPLLAALPTVPTKGGRLRTAVMGIGMTKGTVRAARVLAQIGAGAAHEVLDTYETLSFRARDAVAEALASTVRTSGVDVDPARVHRAIDVTLIYAEALLAYQAYPVPGGLLGPELEHRLRRSQRQLLDLAMLCAESTIVERARRALGREGRARGNALELLEQILPAPFARRTVDLFERQGAVRVDAFPFDGWLARCDAFDRRRHEEEDPMIPVLQRLVVLRGTSLFEAMSTEELFPVGEIATEVAFGPGAVVVAEGGVGDALYVLVEGSLEVERGGAVVRALEPGETFGELALLDGAPRAATVRAATHSRCLCIPKAEFDALLDQCPELARGVIRTLVAHLREAEAGKRA